VIRNDAEAPALVVFEDGFPEIERVARAIAERVGGGGRSPAARAAPGTTIPAPLAAGLSVFGAETTDAPSFGEIARALKGMNLAGRKAAFFGSSGAAVAALRAMCVDTEVAAAHADLVGRKLEGTALSAWLRGIA